jgi:hypothetical protein
MEAAAAEDDDAAGAVFELLRGESALELVLFLFPGGLPLLAGVFAGLLRLDRLEALTGGVSCSSSSSSLMSPHSSLLTLDAGAEDEEDCCLAFLGGDDVGAGRDDDATVISGCNVGEVLPSS